MKVLEEQAGYVTLRCMHIAVDVPLAHGIRLRGRPWSDAALALGVTGMALVSIAGIVPGSVVASVIGGEVSVAVSIGVVLVLVGTVSLAWRRQAPLLVLGLTGGSFVVVMALEGFPSPFPFAPLIALYSVASLRLPPVSAMAAGVLAVGLVSAAIARAGPLDDDVLDYALLGVAAWTLGYGARLSRFRAGLLAERAIQIASEQSTRTQLAVEHEQARIARELHDIIAHHVCLIVAQASAYQRVSSTEPEQARRALGSIETLAREALTEMRRLVSAVPNHETDPERSPQPGLKQVPALIAQIETAGLPVRLVVQGTPRPLPAGVELNAFRIVQEALTNTLKHAGPTRAAVELDYHEEFLDVRVRDEGRPNAPSSASGRGLVGMRQRAALLGGWVDVGPMPEGGFLVAAHLPIAGEQP